MGFKFSDLSRKLVDLFGEVRHFPIDRTRETAPPGQQFIGYDTRLCRPETIPGLWHQTCGLLCLLEEAKLLGRRAILPLLPISPLHNGGHMARSRFEKYWDFSGLLPEQEALPREVFEQMDFAGREVVPSGTPTESLTGCAAALLVRRFPNWNWHEMADRLPNLAEGADGTSQRWLNGFAFRRLRPARRVLALASEVERMLGRFAAVHVRRGDRVRDPEWDRATRPDAIAGRLHKWLPPGTRVYILSDERAPGFFAPLNGAFEVFTMADFPLLRALVEEERDNYMLMAVEWELMRRASFAIGTEPNKGPVMSPYSLRGPAETSVRTDAHE